LHLSLFTKVLQFLAPCKPLSLLRLEIEQEKKGWRCRGETGTDLRGKRENYTILKLKNKYVLRIQFEIVRVLYYPIDIMAIGFLAKNSSNFKTESVSFSMTLGLETVLSVS